MVQFNEASYTVTIATGTNPIEDWLELQSEILGVLAVLDMQQLCMPMPYRLINLLRDMHPDYKVALKMIK
jgi:hypothetical protein